MCNDHGDPFIVMLHNVFLAPYLCNRLFSILTLINSGNNCLFHKGFCMVYFGAKEKMQLHYQIVHKGTLQDTNKHIEVADGHHVTAKKSQVQIKMCDDHGDPFIETLHNVILAPDLCDRLYSIIKFMNSGHTCLFPKVFCTVYFGEKEKNAVTLPHSAQRKHAFLGEIKEISKTKKLPARNKFAL